MNAEYPILEALPRLKSALHNGPIVVLQAPPGAGKSTVLPLELLDESWLGGQKVIMLEPRRLAARAVAHRLSMLHGDEPGQTIGYRIRFENNVTAKTRIEVVTEGILTRQLQSDNALEGVGLVIFDEFHERSLQADLALALCRQVQQVLRSDLRILIMSATLEAEGLSAQLGNAPVVTSEGRQYPVDLRYYTFDPDAHLTLRMARAIRKALAECTGDVLAFFPGAGEISKTKELLVQDNTNAAVHVLYGDLPIKKQQEAIQPDPSGARKVVLATSIAETSLTIEGVSAVVDCGFSRVLRFDPRSGLTRLETVRITRDSATQRAGRAGRLGPGACYRLWSEGVNASLQPARRPEILDADLASLILELSQWGSSDTDSLSWISPPPPGAAAQARELLEELDALENGRITERGKRMLKLPTHPRLAHMLLAAGTPRLQGLAADIAALLEERDPLDRTASADVSLRTQALREYRKDGRSNGDKNILGRVERLAENWRRIFRLQPDNSFASETETGMLIAAAYPDRIARQTQKGSDRYTLANGRRVKLPPNDPLVREPWLAVAALDGASGEGKIFLAAPLLEADLHTLASEHERIRWDAERGAVTGVIEKRIGSVVLASRPLLTIPDETRVEILCRAVQEEGLRMIGWSDAETEWQARVMSLRTWRPADGWPDVSTAALLATAATWLPPFLQGVMKRADLAKLDLSGILASLLPWELSRQLDELAPPHLEVPTGSIIRVQYFEHGQSPVMEVRLQEVFGWLETPVVNDGRMRITMHLLSPGYKPVQVTSDLRSFWENAYHEVRKQLRIRYPKHSWPDDPFTAKAVRGAIRRKR